MGFPLFCSLLQTVCLESQGKTDFSFTANTMTLVPLYYFLYNRQNSPSGKGAAHKLLSTFWAVMQMELWVFMITFTDAEKSEALPFNICFMFVETLRESVMDSINTFTMTGSSCLFLFDCCSQLFLLVSSWLELLLYAPWLPR